MIFAVVGPSGAGKDTLIAGARALRPEIRLARRVITRPSDAGGEDFDGVSDAEFEARAAAGEFALHWQAHGLRYGIPAAQLSGNGPVVFNGSRAALPLARQVFPDLTVILISAPAPVLAARLAQRGRESDHDIRARLDRASFDLPPGFTARLVMNDGPLDAGVAALIDAIYPPSGTR